MRNRILDIAALCLAIAALVLGLSWCAFALWLVSAVCSVISLTQRPRRAFPIIMLTLDALGIGILIALVCTGFTLTMG